MSTVECSRCKAQFSSTDSGYLSFKSGKKLCPKCAKPVYSKASDLVYVKDEHDFDQKREQLIETAKMIYAPDIVESIEELLKDLKSQPAPQANGNEMMFAGIATTQPAQPAFSNGNPYYGEAAQQPTMVSMQGAPMQNAPMQSAPMQSAPTQSAPVSSNFNTESSKGMFKNIAGKIKILAVVITIIGMIASVAAAILLFFELDEDLWYMSVVVLLVGPVLSWVSSFALYGFGRLIETSERSGQLLEEINRKIK